MVRRFISEGLIVEVVVHIGQHGCSGGHLFDPAKGLGQMAMRRVRVPTQGIDDPAFQVFKMRPRGIGDGCDIGQIGHVIHAKAKRVDAAVVYGERGEGQAAARAVDGTRCASVGVLRKASVVFGRLSVSAAAIASIAAEMRTKSAPSK